MIKKLAFAACAATLALATALPANAEVRRSGQAGWDVYQGRLGLKIGANPSAVFGNDRYCSSRAVKNDVYSYYSQQEVEFVGNISDLIGRMNGEWGGSGDTDGMVYADVFDCGRPLPGKRLTGAVCIRLDISQPLGTVYCGEGTQE